jgi:thiamine-monophosphate kinase
VKEFDIIDNYFYKLVAKEEALNLQDDCAVFKSQKQIIVNVDSIIENEHFFSTDPASSIAHKLLNVNLSDIASMGAKPKYWTMAISIPRDRLVNEKWLFEFCNTLQSIQKEHNFYLISGDTTFSNGSLIITANVFGEVAINKNVLKKSTAQQGDILCVSGFIGDSYWGLKLLKDKYKNTKNVSLSGIQDVDYLIHKYQYPEARISLGNILIDYANACTDISDGLWADVEKMCRFSKVLGIIDINSIPISKSVKNISNIEEKEKIINSICGGDDYELVFSISKEKLVELQSLISEKNIFIKQIGYVKALEKTIGNNNKYIQFFDGINEIYTKKTGYNY